MTHNYFFNITSTRVYQWLYYFWSRMSESVIIPSSLEGNDERNNFDTMSGDFLMSLHMDDQLPVEEKVSLNKKLTRHQQRVRRRRASLLTVGGSENQNSEPDFSAFDESTNEILKRIYSRNHFYIGKRGKIVGKGENSIVLHAWISVRSKNKYTSTYKWDSTAYAVKVYKLTEDKIKNERIFQRLQNEKEHLLSLYEAKSNVPEVQQGSQNVLVMSMIGMEQESAPSVTSVPLKLCQEIYCNIVKEMKMWYNTLHLVHGKLSTRNILYWKKQLYYIGWSHSVRREHPLALKKLLRDCHFVTKFFESRLIPVKSTDDLLEDITGHRKINNTEDLWKSQHLTNPNRIGFSTSHRSGGNCRFK